MTIVKLNCRSIKIDINPRRLINLTDLLKFNKDRTLGSKNKVPKNKIITLGTIKASLLIFGVAATVVSATTQITNEYIGKLFFAFTPLAYFNLNIY
jgi:hypothetical protein